jgi:hypothetical protein
VSQLEEAAREPHDDPFGAAITAHWKPRVMNEGNLH